MRTSRKSSKSKIVNANISLTAYRAIKILTMLIEKPCSNAEIINAIKVDKVINRSTSDDTVRVTLNSLKKVGCEISRPSATNNYKYVLKSHPFGFTIKKHQIKILATIRKDALRNNDWESVIALNSLYDKLFSIQNNQQFRDLINHNKPFGKIRPEILKLLQETDLENKEIVMNYATSSKRESYINVVVDRVFCDAGKIYLWAWYFKRNMYSYFNADKILSINSIKDSDVVKQKELYKAIYKLSGDEITTFKSEPEERILETTPNSILVQYTVINEFKFFQRLLTMGANFELISPEIARERLSQKIERMKARYF